jgi:hypothetical protein
LCDSLEKAKIDFQKEALVLIVLQEPSISDKVNFDQVTLEGNSLKCKISRYIPAGRSWMEAFYGFALAMDKNIIRKIEIEICSKREYYADLSDEEPFTKYDTTKSVLIIPNSNSQ